MLDPLAALVVAAFIGRACWGIAQEASRILADEIVIAEEDVRAVVRFVPEVLGCARAMKAGMVHIEPILAASGIKPVGRVVMGTVKGDLHDIGKNLCIMMLRGSGFEVFDLGVDTAPGEFIEAVEKHEAPLMGMSALLTTTMPNMAATIEAFIDEDLRDEVKIMVGGAPVSQDFADDMGADGYGKDAMECVALAKRLLAQPVEEMS